MVQYLDPYTVEFEIGGDTPGFLLDPEGKQNAVERGQSESQYQEDWFHGHVGEWGVYFILKNKGVPIGPPDTTRGQNRHAADLVADDGRMFHVKTQTKRGRKPSVVFQHSAVARYWDPYTCKVYKKVPDNEYLAIAACCIQGTSARVSLRYSVPLSEALEKLQVMEKEHLRWSPSHPGGKWALYLQDLGVAYAPPPPFFETNIEITTSSVDLDTAQDIHTPIGLDTETCLISPGRLAPPMVCVSWAKGESSGVIDHMNAESFLRDTLTDSSVTIYGLNIAYDMAVIANEYPSLLKSVFDAYWDGRVRDVGLDQRLIDIAKGQVRRYEKTKGSYSLAGLTKRLLKIDLEKEDTPRLEYGRLRHVPVEEYSEAEIEYAKLDAVYPLQIHAKQLEIDREWITKRGKGLFADAGAQARHAFSLHLASCWGVRADAGRCEVLMQSLEKEIEECRKLLVREGLIRDNGTRNIAAARERMIQVMSKKGIEPLKTDKGGIKLDQEATDLSGDDVLKAYTRFVGASGLRTKVKDFWYGSKVPLQPRYHTLKDTGRTSCSKPSLPLRGTQLQNPPRIGGARECLEPREGYVFIDADFTAAETHALAQTLLELFGKSALADLLNSGVDTHCYTAANLLGLTYEEVDQAPPKKRKWYRNFAKAFAFGVPGGLGVGTFVRYATVVYGVEMTESEARHHIHNYKRIIFPDIGCYLDLIGRHCDRSNVWYYPWSKRWRGGLTYTACANGNFQVRTADGALDALDAVQWACYTQTDSPLWGCRPFGFIHDQILAEAPVHRAREAAEELGRVMAETYNKWVPDVPTKAEPSIMWRWSKVDPSYDEQGRLTVSDPENAPAWAKKVGMGKLGGG